MVQHPTFLTLLLISLCILQAYGSVESGSGFATRTNDPDTTTTLSSTSDHQHDQNEPLQVIYAGMGRFGTSSLRMALERLGYKTTHGTVIAKDLNGDHALIGKAMMEGNVEALLDATSALGYNATTTSHNIYWEEMAKLRPDAKVIFMMRDFESWFDSLSLLLTQLVPLQRYPLRFIPFFDDLATYTEELTKRSFEDEYTESEIQEMLQYPAGNVSRRVYRKVHDQFVQSMNTMLENEPHRAFLFHKRDGYAALCTILDIPAAAHHHEACPIHAPFPHLHKQSDVIRQGRFFSILEALLCVGILLLVGLMMMVVLGFVMKVRVRFRDSSGSSSSTTSTTAIKAQENKLKSI